MNDTSLSLSNLLEPAVMAALLALARALRSAKYPYVLVGATARMLMLDRYVLPEGSALIRRTADIDAAIQVAGWGDFQKIKKSLLSRGFIESKLEHRLVYQGVAVDIMPYDETSSEGSYFVWPESGMSMSMLGFKEAFACTQEVVLRPDVKLSVVSIPALVLLKIISYGDRTAPRDLEDIWFCLKYYEDNSEATRRFDCTDVFVEGERLSYEEAGAYLIGVDLRSIITPAAKEAVCIFLAQFRDAYSPVVNRLMRILNQFDDSEGQRGDVLRAFRALAEGLGC